MHAVVAISQKSCEMTTVIFSKMWVFQNKIHQKEL